MHLSTTPALTGVPATLLMPLWARARETERRRPILRDPKSADLVASVDYDFGTFAKRSVPIADYCIRSKIFDDLVRAQLETQPASTVLEVGVGLDTRFDRLDNGRVRWIELDLPEVIQLRQQFFETTDRRKMLAGSLVDAAWFDALQAVTDQVDLVVAEGVFYFLTAGQVRQLLTRLSDVFAGVQVIFDAQSPLFLRFSNFRQPIARAELKFSLRRPGDLERWDPRFRVTRSVGFGDSPSYDGLMHRLAWYKRLLGWAHPLTRNLFQIVQLQLGGLAGTRSTRHLDSVTLRRDSVNKVT